MCVCENCEEKYIKTHLFDFFTQPSWRHLPHLSDRHMIAYKQSDVKLSWMDNVTTNAFPKVCGYVKEGASIGKYFHCAYNYNWI